MEDFAFNFNRLLSNLTFIGGHITKKYKKQSAERFELTTCSIFWILKMFSIHLVKIQMLITLFELLKGFWTSLKALKKPARAGSDGDGSRLENGCTCLIFDEIYLIRAV